MFYSYINPLGAITMSSDTDLKIVETDSLKDPELYYFDFGSSTIKPKEDMPISIKGSTISNIPSPATVIVDHNDPVVVTDGTLEVSSDTNETVFIVIETQNPKWLKKEINLEVSGTI